MRRTSKRVVPREEFALAGYDSLHWFQGTERLSTQPEVGTTYHLKSEGPFPSLSRGEEFWSVFRPPFSHFNGWEERLEEIEDSSFVRSQILGLEGQGLNVKVLDVLPLSGSLELQGTPTTLSIEEVSLLDAGRRSVESWSRWTLIDNNMEGDVGEWFLLRRREDKTYLILFGEWDFERDWVYMGYSEVPEP